MGSWRGKHFWAFHFNYGRGFTTTKDMSRAMADFFDIQAKISNRPRARRNGGFKIANNTQVRIVQATWPHLALPTETYAIELHGYPIIYLCHNATAAYDHPYSGSRTTLSRMYRYQYRNRENWFYQATSFGAGALHAGRAKIIELPRKDSLSTDLRNTVVLEDHEAAPRVWLPDGRRFWVRTDDQRVLGEVKRHLKLMIDHAEPFTSQLDAHQVDRLKAGWVNVTNDVNRLTRAIAASRDGKMIKALAGMCWKQPRAYRSVETKLPDKVVQMLRGMYVAEETLKNIDSMSSLARVQLGVTYLQDADTENRVYAEIDKDPPDSWLVDLLYGLDAAAKGTMLARMQNLSNQGA